MKSKQPKNSLYPPFYCSHSFLFTTKYQSNHNPVTQAPLKCQGCTSPDTAEFRSGASNHKVGLKRQMKPTASVHCYLFHSHTHTHQPNGLLQSNFGLADKNERQSLSPSRAVCVVVVSVLSHGSLTMNIMCLESCSCSAL